MKTNIKLMIISAMALTLLTVNSCTDKFDELNTNPSLITQELVNPNLILTYVQMNAIVMGSNYGNGTLGSYCGMCVRHDDGPFVE